LKVGAIIFSRMSSTRLPKKAMLEISGRSLLGRVIDRSKHIKGIDEIIVATSNDKDDDEIANLSAREGVKVYRGSLENVTLRALSTCKEYNLDKFVRICGDRPFFDPNLISNLIDIYKGKEIDLLTTTFPRTYPPGLTVEIISSKALEYAFSSMSEEDKEHVTKFFYRYPDKFSIKNITAMENLDFKDINLCLDTLDDLKRIEWIASQIEDSEYSYASMKKIVSLAQIWNKNN